MIVFSNVIWTTPTEALTVKKLICSKCGKKK